MSISLEFEHSLLRQKYARTLVFAPFLKFSSIISGFTDISQTLGNLLNLAGSLEACVMCNWGKFRVGFDISRHINVHFPGI